MWHILKPLLRRPLMPLLVILQVALACAIACNALFLLQQKLAPLLAPTGIGDPANLTILYNIAVQGAPPSQAQLRSVEADLRAAPGVAHATYAAAFPMVTQMGMQAKVLGSASHAEANAAVFLGDDLLPVLGLQLVAGRNFTAEEAATELGSDMGFSTHGPVIVTRALANHLYPDGHALGKTIHYADSPGGDRTIVGVVAHLMRTRFTGHSAELAYTMLFPGWAAHFPMSIFAVRTNGAHDPHVCKALTAAVQRSLGARLLPGNEVQCNTYATLRNAVLAQPRAAVWLLAGVTLIVLLVTLTGIMGMTGYWVQQRTRSIGVRRALGARRSDILRELLIENAWVVGIGMVLGLAAAYGINLWLMRHYELLRLPWIYLPVGAALLLALGQLAAFTPALRASRIPPIVATRAI